MDRPGAARESELRIVYVLDLFPELTETFIANELAELRRRAVDIRILALRRPTAGVVHRLIAAAGLDAVTCYDHNAFAEVIAVFRPALLHAHFATEATAAARELALRFGIPYTFTAHGYDVYRRPPADFAQRAAAAAHVVTVSEANARHIASTFGVPRARIAVISNAVDTALFRPRPDAAARGESPPLIVCVARHEPVKNLGLLLDACAGLQRLGVAFRCVLVGDGACRPALEARSRELGLEGHVEFAGAVEQSAVIGWLQRASLAVLTSHSEGMPVSLIEAAACGVPAVATAVGGISELVTPEVTGLLCTPGDAMALTAALQSLLARPYAAAAMGREARRRVEAAHSLERQAGALLALWRGILARRMSTEPLYASR